jgi:hypothetical protein
MNNLFQLIGVRGMVAWMIGVACAIYVPALAQPSSDSKPSATTEVTQWVYPMENRTSHGITSEDEFAKYQQAEYAVWRHASRDFLFRWITPIPVYAYHVGSTITARSIIGSDSYGYHLETVELQQGAEGKWVVLNKTVAPAESAKVKQGYEIFVKHLLNAKMHADGQGMGLDVPVTLWECQSPNKERSAILQGTDAGDPTTEEDKKNSTFLVNLLCVDGWASKK